MKKAWPPSNISSRAPGMADARNSLLAGGAIPSKRPPHTRVGQAMVPSRPEVSCSARAANWLVRPWAGGSPAPEGMRSAMRATISGCSLRQASSHRVSRSSIRRADAFSGLKLTSSCSG